MTRWLCVKLSCCPAAEEENVIAELWALGTVGVEQVAGAGGPELRAYFEIGRSVRGERCARDAAHWARRGATLLAADEIADGDWMAAYRRRVRPFRLGRRFAVDPREPMGEARVGRRTLLRLPARRAFGIGSHESTRLVVEWLEAQDLRRKRVLDLGTGTGILSFVALELGARSVVGLEIDPAAAFAARANQVLNRRRFPLAAASVDAHLVVNRYDLVLANLLPSELEPVLSSVVRLLRPRAQAVFSGLRDADAHAFRHLVEAADLSVRELLTARDWVALVAVVPRVAG